MNRKLSKFAAYVISVTPFSIVRCTLYRLFFGYSLRDVHLGFGSVLAVERANFMNCSIGRFTRFIGPMSVSIESAVIGANNTFRCGPWAANTECESKHYKRSLIIERDTMITSNHFFDITGSFTLGARSWIAGCGSQFWTHGAGAMDRNITIGQQCYIASAVRFAPGTQISDNTLVGLGSVLTRRFSEPNILIAGAPARIIKEDYDWEFRPQFMSTLRKPIRDNATWRN